jgi:hypothetical protein
MHRYISQAVRLPRIERCPTFSLATSAEPTLTDAATVCPPRSCGSSLPSAEAYSCSGPLEYTSAEVPPTPVGCSTLAESGCLGPLEYTRTEVPPAPAGRSTPESSQVITLPKAKSKTRSKKNNDMHKCSSVYSERGVPLPVLTSGGE